MVWQLMTRLLVPTVVAVGALVLTPDAGLAQDGELLYNNNCEWCHGSEGTGGVVERPVRGARACSIWESSRRFIPGMEFLLNLSPSEFVAIADYLNSFDVTDKERYDTACLGCHGKEGEGGRVSERVRGESAGEIWRAIRDEEAMSFMFCIPADDIRAIARYLQQVD